MSVNQNEKHIEEIKCPECNMKQYAVVEHSTPFYTYIHHCWHCEYIILESEWEKVK